MTRFKSTLEVALLVLFALSVSTVDAQVGKADLIDDRQVSFIDRTSVPTNADHPIAFARDELIAAIDEAGGSATKVRHWTQTDRAHHLIIGTVDNRLVHRLLEQSTDTSLTKDEGVFYQWCRTESGYALVVAGTDDRGLMYALTELAQRVQANGMEALAAVENTVQFPDNPIRGLDRFIFDRHDHSWYFSDDFWRSYIERLARNRFNRLTLISGYRGGFMVPPYPFFVDVAGYEGVGLDPELGKTRQQYLAQLREIGRLCEAHGLDFVFGTWSHATMEGRISGNEYSRGDQVVGLPENAERYTEYSAKGMRALLREAPEIDGIHMRINYEAGIGEYGKTAENFWSEIVSAIGDVHREREKDLFVDLRAKGLTPQMREWVLEAGMDLHVPTKYTWEATGLPYQPMRMREGELANLDNRDRRQRYSYADFLREPRSYDVIYRLWSIGTNRLLTWGDPDYARRFSQTVKFGGGRGFQVTPPLSMKVNTWSVFEDEDLIYYEWEDERYWLWYLLFGRLGYSADTAPEVWQRAFRAHYGEAGRSLEAAYRAAGKVLPLVTSAHLTRHPAWHNWAEMDTGAALFSEHNVNEHHGDLTYQDVEPGDPGMFYIVRDYVEDVLAEEVKGKITPVQLAGMYERLAERTREALENTELEKVPQEHRTEFRTNRLDLQITADLAEFHSLKTRAATDLVFYRETGEAGYLTAALQSMRAAAENRHQMVERTEGTYHDHPKFGADAGRWDARLEEVDKDVAQLEEMMQQHESATRHSHWDDVEKEPARPTMTTATAKVPDQATPNAPVEVELQVGDAQRYELDEVTVHYRRANQAEGRFRQTPMQWNGNAYVAAVPAQYLTARYDLLVYFTAKGDGQQPLMYPGLFHPEHVSPYFSVEVDPKQENK